MQMDHRIEPFVFFFSFLIKHTQLNFIGWAIFFPIPFEPADITINFSKLILEPH